MKKKEETSGIETTLDKILTAIRELSHTIQDQQETLNQMEKKINGLSDRVSVEEERIFRGEAQPSLSESHKQALSILRGNPKKKMGAWELANELGLSRSRGSEILNELWKMDFLEKFQEKRKVKFKYKEEKEEE